jgi:hypothetical protein
VPENAAKKPGFNDEIDVKVKKVVDDGRAAQNGARRAGTYQRGAPATLG